jgi:hypothetical protein
MDGTKVLNTGVWLATDDVWYDTDTGITVKSSSGPTFNRANLGYPDYQDMITGTRNPNFKKQIVKREDATTYYLRRETTAESCIIRSTSVTKRPANHFRHWQHSRGYLHKPVYVYNSVRDTTLRDQAVKKLKSKLAEFDGQFDSLAPLVELREMRGLIRSLIPTTVQLVREIIKLRRLRGNSEAIKVAGQLWLSYNFGIAPTLKDIDAVQVAINKWLMNNNPVARFVATKEKKWRTSTEEIQGGASGTNDVLKGTWDHKLRYRFTAGLTYSMVSANNYNLQKHLGFSPPSIIPALYELTIFSWVADYFGTAGEYFEDTFQNKGPGTTFYCVESRKYTVNGTVNGQVVSSGTPDLISYSGYAIPGLLKFVEFERTPLTTLPARILRFKTTDEIGRNAVVKLLNLISVYSNIRR